MNRRLPKLIAFWVTVAALGLSLIVLPYFCSQDFVVQTWLAALQSGDPDPGHWGTIDQTFLKAPPGDVAVRFINFREGEPVGGAVVHQDIQRGAYALLPRRLWATDENVVVLGAPQVLQANFNPTAEWLQQHNVRSIIWVTLDSNNNVQLSGARIPALPGAPEPLVEASRGSHNGLDAVLWCTCYVGVLMLVGLALVWIILPTDDRRSLVELAGLTLLLGPGAAATFLVWISMLGIGSGRLTILLLGAGAVLVLIALHLRGRRPRPLWPEPLAKPFWMTLPAVVPVLILLSGFTLLTVASLWLPILNWDSFNIWGFKAKALYSMPLRPRPVFFTDKTLSFTHLDYPLMLPMLMAGAYGMMGQVNEFYGKIAIPILFAGGICLMYAAARHWLGRLAALTVTAIFICSPNVIRYSWTANAEMPLAIFRLGAVVYLIRWIKFNRRCDAIFAALFSIFAATTKNEGLALAVIDIMVMLGFVTLRRASKRSWLDLGIFAVMLSVGIGIWVAWRSGSPHTDENYPERLKWTILADNFDRIDPILYSMGHLMAAPIAWGGFWLILSLVAILGFRAFASPETIALWILLFAHLGLYTMIYIITSWDLMTLLRDSLSRLQVHVAPTAALLIAAHLAAVYSRKAHAPG